MCRKWVFALLALALVSCSRESPGTADPQRRLSDYISKSFAVSSISDRDQLASYLTGQAKARLLAWSEDQFRQAFIESKRQYLRLVVLEKKSVSKQEAEITYELSFLDQAKGHDAKVTNKKLCRMVLQDGKWYIADVRNLKELVEYRDEMSLP